MTLWAKVIWDILVSLSLVAIVVALVIEFLFHPDEATLGLIHIIDAFALSFLFVELLYSFYRAEDKKKFVTREWLLIISFLPFGTIFRVARIFRSSRVVIYLSAFFAKLARLLRLERVGIKTAQSTVHASKIGRLLRPVAQFFSKKEKLLKEIRKK